MNPNDRHDPKRTGGEEKPSGGRFARAVEYSVAFFLTTTALAMHLRYFLDAGGLWRDEISSVNLANTNPFPQAIANLHHDSFPIIWLLVVRFWQRSGIGVSDQGMRTLGLLVGSSILTVLWRNARRFGLTAPVISLALLGFTSAVICYGDSIRGYGLGMLLGILAMGLIWEMTRKQTSWTFIAALIAALLSVHTLFYNSVLLLAACCGAFAVMLPKRQWKRSGLVLAIGLICAATTLVYLPMIEHTRDLKMWQAPLDFATLRFDFQNSLAFLPDGNVAPGFSAAIWELTAVAALFLGLALLCFRGAKALSGQRRDAVIFCAAHLVVGVLAYAAFLKFLSYRLPAWYFLAAMAMIAASLDGLFGGVRSPIFRILLAVCAAGFALNAALPVWKNVGVRRTNVDLIAAKVQQWSVKGDIVVIAPWNMSGPFLRYYRGDAEVTAIPPISFLAYQQFDLLLKFMTDPNAMDPLIRKLSEVLRHGHRVWIVGDHGFPSGPPTSPYFQNSPDPVYGWLVPNYQKSWQDQVFYALKSHSRQVLLVSIPTDRPVSYFENESLSVVQGWNERSNPTTRPQ
jgi:hypothetical protein